MTTSACVENQNMCNCYFWIYQRFTNRVFLPPRTTLVSRESEINRKSYVPRQHQKLDIDNNSNCMRYVTRVRNASRERDCFSIVKTGRRTRKSNCNLDGYNGARRNKRCFLSVHLKSATKLGSQSLSIHNAVYTSHPPLSGGFPYDKIEHALFTLSLVLALR